MRRMMVLCGATVVAGAVLTSEAAVLCKKKNGLVAVRDSACAKKETLVDPVSLGLQGPTGATGSQGPTGAAGTARAYGEVQINAISGDYELVPGSTKNVVGITQGGGGNPAACIELDASIDASTAIVMAIPNLRTEGASGFDTQVLTSRPLGYCSGTNVVEVITTRTDSPGAATKRAFHFAVL